MIPREAIVEIGRRFIGTPFHHQGRLPGVGLDCIGLLVAIATELEIPHQDYRAYSRHPSGQELERRLSRSGLEQIDLEEAGDGDVLTFWIRRHGMPQHVGVRTNDGLLHTYASVGRVVEHPWSDPWDRRTWSAWRFPGVE